MSDLLSPLVRRVIAPLWAWHEKSDYLGHLRVLEASQFAGPEEILRRQWQAVREIALHAYRHTRFWRQRFDELGMRPELLRDWNDFRRLGVLTKDDLRQRGNDLVAAGDRRGWHEHKTSGSSGKSVRVLVDDPAQQWRRACTLRSDEWSGWRLGEKVALVWGNPEYLHLGWRGRLRNALLDRASYLDTLWMDEAAMERFVRLQVRRRPTLLMGHAHSLYLLAGFIERSGLKAFRPRGIISTAMCLHAHERARIERVFQVPVTNRYGCEEVSLIACQCERHGGLHVNCDGVYLEILNSEGAAAGPGQPGAVVVTDLTNRAMPLLRYRLGDVAAWAAEPCACGRGLPLLERIEGREADYVVTPGGQYISGISLTENFALLLDDVAQLQIIQDRLDHLEFRIVPAPDFQPQSLQRIAELVARRFGQAMRHDCRIVERIEPEPSGKYRFCISRLSPAAAAPGEVVAR